MSDSKHFNFYWFGIHIEIHKAIAIFLISFLLQSNCNLYAIECNTHLIKNENIKNTNTKKIHTSNSKIASPDYTWTGANNDNLWFSPQNWAPIGVPSSTDNVAIGVSGFVQVLIQNSTAYANSIELTGNSSIEIAATGSLTLTTSPLELYNGTLKGAGTFYGDVHVSIGGHIAPGNPNTGTPGTLTIDGNLNVDMDAGVLEIQINATVSGQYSVLNVTGSADLLNDLYVYYGNYNNNYYSPYKNDNVVIITANSLSGSIANPSPIGWNPTYDEPTTGMVKINYDPPPPSNEDCSNAIPITSIPGNYGSYTINAQNSVAPVPTCNNNGQYDIWYSFVAPASGTILLQYIPPTIQAVTIWSSVCGSLIQNSCYAYNNNGQNCNQLLDLNLVNGETYYIQLITVNEESNVNFNIIEPIGGPANDFCSGAIPIMVGGIGECPTGEVMGTTVNAHHTENVSCTYDWECNNLDVWYSFTTPASGRVKFKPTVGNLSAVIFSGSCGSLIEAGCLSQEGSVFLTGSTSYFLMISTRNDWQGVNFTFCLEEAEEPPANNTCSGAISIPVSANGNCNYVTGTTINATSSLDNPCAFGEDQLHLLDAWYSFEAPPDALVTFYSGTGDPTVAVYEGSCGSLTLVENGCTIGSGTIIGLSTGETYYLQIMTPNGESDFDFCLEISGSAPSNNNCSDAISMTLGSLINVPSTIYAIPNPELPPCAPPSLNTPSIWYKFIASSDEVTYDNDNAFILALSIYNGCGGVSEILPDACALPYSDGNPNTAVVIPGNTYYAQITTVPAKTTGYHFAINSTGTLSYPEIDVQGNSISIDDGDISPELSDDTKFGDHLVCSGSVIKTFTINNTSGLILHVSAINISGLNAGDFVIGGISLPIEIAANGSETFTVEFNPSALGIRVATIEIESDDIDESTFDYAISGIGAGVYAPEDDLYYCNLADAINAMETEDGDVLQIESGVYLGPCIIVNKSITLIAIDGSVTLDCVEINGNGNMLDLGSDFMFNMLMLMDGKIHLNGHHLSCGSITGGSRDSYIIVN